LYTAKNVIFITKNTNNKIPFYTHPNVYTQKENNNKC
jgi:hypothetical protein